MIMIFWKITIIFLIAVAHLYQPRTVPLFYPQKDQQATVERRTFTNSFSMALLSYINMEKFSSEDDVNLMEYITKTVEGQMPDNVAKKFLTFVAAQGMNINQPDFNQAFGLIGTNKKVCIICAKRRIVIGKITMHCLVASKVSKSVLKVYAERQGDYSLLERLKSNTKIWLHTSCWTIYSRKCNMSSEVVENNNRKELHVVRGLHKVAYATVCEFVQDEIIDKEQSIILYDLDLQYRTILFTLNENEPLALDNYNYFNLREKLLKDFGEELVMENIGSTDQELLHKKGVADAFGRIVPTNVSWTYKQIKQALHADI